MPQVQLPFFPEEITHINADLALIQVPPELIDSGWQGFMKLAGIGDLDEDGAQDILAQRDVIMTGSNKTIKIHCIESGEISTDNGDTVFSNLFMLGAFALTSKLNGKKMRVEYQADAEGLKFLR